MRAWIWVAACAVVLAGCSDSGPVEESDDITAEEDFDDYALEETAPEFGVVKGVVVDTAFTPMPDVLVTLTSTGQNLTTGPSGVFAFKDVEPGVQFITAERPGYDKVQTSTDVVAGDTDPETVRMQMERIPGTEPSVIPLQFDGHITCSARIPTGFATGCLLSIAVGDFGGDRMDFDVGAGNVDWMQTELTWDAQTDLANNMCLRVYGYETGDVCGPDSVVQAIDGPAAKASGLGEGTPIEVVVYVDFFVEPAFGLAVDQPFQAFTHVFYNWVPDEGWLFSDSGEPVPPV